MRDMGFSTSKKYGVIIAAAIALVGALALNYKNDIQNYKDNYLAVKNKEAQFTQSEVEKKLGTIYQSLRTISLIPGVRKIDRYGKNFDPDARMTIQQIYNNLVSNINFSEVYILPADFNPEKIDTKTLKGEEPIISFDEFIVADYLQAKGAKEKSEDKDKLEEVEIFEYREMAKHINSFKEKFRIKKSFKDLDVPMYSSKEVITCDNSEFTKKDFQNKNDEPRKGLIFMVPIYDMSGDFHGSVAGVIRSNVLRKLLPNDDYKLTNATTSFSTKPQENEKNPMFFSKKIDLKTGDVTTWQLEVNHDEVYFNSSLEVRAARNIFWMGVVIVFLMATVLIYQVRVESTFYFKISKSIAFLSKEARVLTEAANRLNQSSSDIADSTIEQTTAVNITSAAMENITRIIEKTTRSSEHLLELAKNGFQVTNNITEMAGSIREVARCQSIIDEQIQSNNEKLQNVMTFVDEINAKTNVINDIVFQTKLLSFNASVEAARAGDHGKGFSVVAQEIGNLAQMSGSSAHDIAKTLNSGRAKIDEVLVSNKETLAALVTQGNDAVKKSLKAGSASDSIFSEVEKNIETINSMAKELFNHTQEQQKKIQESMVAVNIIVSATQKNTTHSKDGIDVSNMLLSQADNLAKLIDDLSSVVQKKNKAV